MTRMTSMNGVGSARGATYRIIREICAIRGKKNAADNSCVQTAHASPFVAPDKCATLAQSHDEDMRNTHDRQPDPDRLRFHPHRGP